MSYRKILSAGIRRRKGYAAATAILSFLITLFTILSVSTLSQANLQFEEAFGRTKMPDIIVFMPKSQEQDGEAAVDKLNNKEAVRQTRFLPILDLESGTYFGSKKVKESNYIREVTQEDLAACVPESASIDTGIPGVWVPVSYKNLYHIEQGDSMTFHIGEKKVSYPVAGFFEDPALGSNMTGIKQIWMSRQEFAQLCQMPGADQYKGFALQIYMRQYHAKSFQETVRSLNESTGVTALGTLYVDHTLMNKSGMLVSNVFLIIILAFSVLMIFITAIVIKYTITASVESDFTQLGILYSLGFTRKMLFYCEILQVMLPFCAGLIPGVLLSIALAPWFGDIVMDGSGVLWKGGVDPVIVLISSAALLLFALMLCSFASRSMLKLSAVQAIQRGRSEASFRSPLNVPLERLSFFPLHLRMALKSVLSRPNQYILLILVSGMMIFTLSSATALKNDLSSPETLNQLFGESQPSDLSVTYQGDADDAGAKEQYQQFVRDIETQYPAAYHFRTENAYLMIDRIKVLVEISDTFSNVRPNAALEGRYPRYDNEIIVTETLAQMLGKEVGDWVTVKNGSAAKRYLITGFNQSTRDAGKIAQMSDGAVEYIYPGFSFSSVNIKLKKEADPGTIVDELKNRVKKDSIPAEITNNMEQGKELLAQIQLGITGVVALFYFLNILLSSLIIFLLSTTMLKKQTMEYVIYHGCGYRTNQLRRQFSYCFGITVLAGAVLGAAADYLWSDQLFSLLFRQIGIIEYHSGSASLSAFAPTALTVLFAVLFAYLVSGQMKRIKMQIQTE